MNEKSKMIVRQTVCLTEELERELAAAAERTDLAKQDVIRLTIRIGLTHLRRINGRYLSSKRGIRFGTGLSTVQGIVRRRGGRAEFTADGQQFRVSIFLPCSSPKDSPVCASSPRGDTPLK